MKIKNIILLLVVFISSCSSENDSLDTEKRKYPSKIEIKSPQTETTKFEFTYIGNKISEARRGDVHLLSFVYQGTLLKKIEYRESQNKSTTSPIISFYELEYKNNLLQKVYYYDVVKPKNNARLELKYVGNNIEKKIFLKQEINYNQYEFKLASEEVVTISNSTLLKMNKETEYYEYEYGAKKSSFSNIDNFNELQIIATTSNTFPQYSLFASNHFNHFFSGKKNVIKQIYKDTQYVAAKEVIIFEYEYDINNLPKRVARLGENKTFINEYLYEY